MTAILMSSTYYQYHSGFSISFGVSHHLHHISIVIYECNITCILLELKYRSAIVYRNAYLVDTKRC